MKTKDMNITDKIQITNEDNMLLMARYPDNYFELAIVDPEYGININHSMGRRKGQKKSNHKKVEWDKSIPEESYFLELKRVSKNQVVWGGNYMTEYLQPSPCWLLWDKGFSEDVTFAQFEMAWTSFRSSAKKYDLNAAANRNKIHPTQKPVALYKWILNKYAKEGDKILDTHLGSGSIAIACHDYKFELTACELDKDYYEASIKRIKDHVKQLTLF
jgi:site-specific DNA-methyltransferase (adenine-specific)